MIASVEGFIIEIGSDHIIIKLGGIGILVYAPTQTIMHCKRGENIFLFTKLIVREDLLALYGFEERQTCEYFNIMLGINGIGPRLALSIMSVLDPETIRRAVLHEQSDVFAQVPGIGKKTAQKILLAIQDKIIITESLEPVTGFNEIDNEVLSALTTLGYSVMEAQSAIQSIPPDAAMDVEIRLRHALHFFS